MLEICDLDSNKFDALQKLMTLLENTSCISIRNSTINNLVETNVIVSHLTDIFGENFNIDIVNPKKYLKLFKIMPKSNIKLFDDPSMNRYVFISGNVQLFLPKKQNSPVFDTDEFNDFEQLGKTINIKDNKKIVKSFISNEIKLLLKNNEFQGILNDDLGIYQFPEYENNEKLNEEDCEVLVSYGFLNIDAEKYEVSLGKKDGEFWLFTTIDFDNISKVYILENVNKKNLDNILI